MLKEITMLNYLTGTASVGHESTNF